MSAHEKALKRAGSVFMWAIDTGGHHPDATPEGAAEQIVAMYLRERREFTGTGAASNVAAAVLLDDFPEKRR